MILQSALKHIINTHLTFCRKLSHMKFTVWRVKYYQEPSASGVCREVPKEAWQNLFTWRPGHMLFLWSIGEAFYHEWGQETAFNRHFCCGPSNDTLSARIWRFSYTYVGDTCTILIRSFAISQHVLLLEFWTF